MINIHDLRTQSVKFHHLGEWIEVPGLCLKQLILYLFNHIDNILLAVGTRTYDRNGLDEHTHDAHHSYVGTSVVNGRDDDVVLTCHCMQHMHCYGQEVTVQSQSVLLTEGFDVATCEMNRQYAWVIILLFNGMWINNSAGIAHQVSEVMFCLVILLRLHQFEFIQGEIKGCIGLNFDIFALISFLDVVKEYQ